MQTHKIDDMQRDQSQPPEGRRSFLNKLWLFLGCAALAEFIWLTVAFLRPREPVAKQASVDNLISCGTVDDFSRGSVTAFPIGRFYLCRLNDGGFLAISRQCTHLGCTVPWNAEEKKFICPCHASAFDLTGNVINAPAPRALDLFPVAIENDRVNVVTGRRVKRSVFRKEQVAYAPKQG